MRSLLPNLMAPAWDFASAAPLLNRMAAAYGLPTTLRAAQDFVSHYALRPRHTIQLYREIDPDLKTVFPATTLWVESRNHKRIRDFVRDHTPLQDQFCRMNLLKSRGLPRSAICSTLLTKSIRIGNVLNRTTSPCAKAPYKLRTISST